MALAATNHQCMWLWGHPPPENFEFSKPCEDISQDIGEEFSQKKLPARAEHLDIQKI